MKDEEFHVVRDQNGALLVNWDYGVRRYKTVERAHFYARIALRDETYSLERMNVRRCSANG